MHRSTAPSVWQVITRKLRVIFQGHPRALDKWREEHELDSRNAAIVAILADYLGVQHPVQLPNNAPLSIHLHTVLDELARISQRMDA
jgi:hypothetical protein